MTKAIREKLIRRIAKLNHAPLKRQDGVYETIYGNAAEFTGGRNAFDLDMGEVVPLDMVCFDKRIRDID